MREVQRLNHNLFRHFVCAAFHHRDSIFHPRDGEVEPAVFQFGVGGIEIVPAVDESDADRRNRMSKRNSRRIESRRCANDGMHRRINVRVGRQYERDDLSLILVTFGE